MGREAGNAAGPAPHSPSPSPPPSTLPPLCCLTRFLVEEQTGAYDSLSACCMEAGADAVASSPPLGQGQNVTLGPSVMAGPQPTSSSSGADCVGVQTPGLPALTPQEWAQLLDHPALRAEPPAFEPPSYNPAWRTERRFVTSINLPRKGRKAGGRAVESSGGAAVDEGSEGEALRAAGGAGADSKPGGGVGHKGAARSSAVASSADSPRERGGGGEVGADPRRSEGGEEEDAEGSDDSGASCSERNEAGGMGGAKRRTGGRPGRGAGGGRGSLGGDVSDVGGAEDDEPSGDPDLQPEGEEGREEADGEVDAQTGSRGAGADGGSVWAGGGEADAGPGRGATPEPPPLQLPGCSEVDGMDEAACLVLADYVISELTRHQVQTHINGSSNLWIVKPAGKSRGRGIRLFNDQDALFQYIKVRGVQGGGRQDQVFQYIRVRGVQGGGGQDQVFQYIKVQGVLGGGAGPAVPVGLAAPVHQGAGCAGGGAGATCRVCMHRVPLIITPTHPYHMAAPQPNPTTCLRPRVRSSSSWSGGGSHRSTWSAPSSYTGAR